MEIVRDLIQLQLAPLAQSEDFMTVGWVGLKMTCSGEQIASLIHQLVSTFSVYLTLIESTPIFMICFVGMTMLQL